MDTTTHGWGRSQLVGDNQAHGAVLGLGLPRATTAAKRSSEMARHVLEKSRTVKVQVNTPEPGLGLLIL